MTTENLLWTGFSFNTAVKALRVFDNHSFSDEYSKNLYVFFMEELPFEESCIKHQCIVT